jgi:AGZA family xanthine/uracil permease-like MFS transporter
VIGPLVSDVARLANQGGRTGLTAIFCSFYFFLSIFFAPILSSVPPWATGPALIIVGAMMMKGVVQVRHRESFQ